MQGDFKIIWSQKAEKEFDHALEYLVYYFSEKEVSNLLNETNRIIKLISETPKIFPISDKKEIRKVVLLKYNTLYYKIIEKNVYIVSFFSNRQSPDKRNIK